MNQRKYTIIISVCVALSLFLTVTNMYLLIRHITLPVESIKLEHTMPNDSLSEKSMDDNAGNEKMNQERSVPDSSRILDAGSEKQDVTSNLDEHSTFSLADNQKSLAESSTLITIPVRIHMLGGTGEESVDTVRSDQEIRDIFSSVLGVNENYWSQANIKFEIESIVPAKPKMISGYQTLVKSALFDTYAVGITSNEYRGGHSLIQANLAPENNLLENGFNIVVVHDFGIMGGGVYQKNKIVYVPEQSIKGNDETIMTFSFAHELGHSLGLAHYNTNFDPYNLMAISNPSIYNPRDKNNLIQDQIDIARQVAASGQPGIPSDFNHDYNN